MEENENNSAITRAGLPLKKDVLIRAGFPLEKGGAGSGNFGHEGRPGEGVGGSGSGGGAEKYPMSNWPKDGFSSANNGEQLGTYLKENNLAKGGWFKEGSDMRINESATRALKEGLDNGVLKEPILVLGSNTGEKYGFRDTTLMRGGGTGGNMQIALNAGLSKEDWDKSRSMESSRIKDGLLPGNAIGYAKNTDDAVRQTLFHEAVHGDYENISSMADAPAYLYSSKHDDACREVGKAWDSFYTGATKDGVTSDTKLEDSKLPSIYSYKDKYEGFAETASLYYSGKSDSLDPQAVSIMDSYSKLGKI